MEQQKFSKKFTILSINFIRNYLVGLIAFIVFILISILIPNFFSVKNIINILVQSSILCLLTIGLTPILITGGLDISLAAIMGLSGIVGTFYIINYKNVFIGILIMIFIGILIGIFNGFCATWLKMVPFIVTLSVMVVTTGLSIWITKGGSFSGLPDAFLLIYSLQIGKFPVFLIVLFIFILITHFIASKSFIGRMLFIVGVNEKAALICGIKTRLIKFVTFAIGGLFAGLAAILLISRMKMASASLAPDSMVLDYISAAAIGGVSIYGGRGSIIGAALGAIFVTTLSNTMNLLGLGFYSILIIKGLVLIFIVSLERFRNK